MGRLSDIFNNWADEHFFIGSVLRTHKYVMVFKTTPYCYYKCKHCCESSGPDRKKIVIPEQVISGYITQALSDPLFSKDLIYTGGEIMSTYKFHSKDYVPNLLELALSNNIKTDIKTNGGWALTGWGQEIFDRMTPILDKYVDNYNLQMSLSLDNFHPNSLKTSTKIISEMAGRKKKMILYVSSFPGQEKMYGDLLLNLKQGGIRVQDAIIQRPDDNLPISILNESVIMNYGTATLFRHGRADNLPESQIVNTPQFQFLSRGDHRVLMAFDADGMVTLGENSGKKIQTRWQELDGAPRPLSDIQKSLVFNARRAEVDFKMRAALRDLTTKRIK